MKITPGTLLSTLFTSLALAAAALAVSALPTGGAEASIQAPVQLAQSTSAILEERSA